MAVAVATVAVRIDEAPCRGIHRVFAGTGAIGINDTRAVITHVGIVMI
jgi:hypothetical protein